MKQKTRFKNFGNIGYQYWLLVQKWSIWIYWPESHIGRSLKLIAHRCEATFNFHNTQTCSSLSLPQLRNTWGWAQDDRLGAYHWGVLHGTWSKIIYSLFWSCDMITVESPTAWVVEWALEKVRSAHL